MVVVAAGTGCISYITYQQFIIYTHNLPLPKAPKQHELGDTEERGEVVPVLDQLNTTP
jgi:hypothetical protein